MREYDLVMAIIEENSRNFRRIVLKENEPGLVFFEITPYDEFDIGNRIGFLPILEYFKKKDKEQFHLFLLKYGFSLDKDVAQSLLRFDSLKDWKNHYVIKNPDNRFEPHVYFIFVNYNKYMECMEYVIDRISSNIKKIENVDSDDESNYDFNFESESENNNNNNNTFTVHDLFKPFPPFTMNNINSHLGEWSPDIDSDSFDEKGSYTINFSLENPKAQNRVFNDLCPHCAFPLLNKICKKCQKIYKFDVESLKWYELNIYTGDFDKWFNNQVPPTPASSPILKE
jgi:hypothetical protein